MISLLLLTPLMLAQEPAITEAPAALLDPITEVNLICAEMASMESFTFEYKSDGDRFGGMGGRGGRGGQATDATSKEGSAEEGEKEKPQPWIVTWQKGQPMLMKNGSFVAASLDAVTAYKDGDGEWKRSERRARGGAGGTRGGAGAGGRGGEGGGQGGGQGGRPERGSRGERGSGVEGGGRPEITPAQMKMFEMRSISLPTSTISNLPDAMDESQVKRSTKLGLVVYEGALTEAGAMDLATNGRGFGGRGGRGGGEGEGPQITYTGNFRMIMGPKGNLKEFTLSTKMKGNFNGQEFERDTSKTYKFSKLGKSKVELSAEVRELLKPTPAQNEEF